MTADAPLLAISGTEFRGLPIDCLLHAADEIAVSAIELWYPENFSAAGDRVSVERLRQWAGTVAAVSCGVEVAETEDVTGTRQQLMHAVELAAQIGAPLVNTYFGAPGYLDDRRSGDTFLRHVDPVLGQAGRDGVTIVLENEFNAFGRDHARGDLTRRPEALRDLIGRAGSPHLRLNFDAANFYCAGVEPYPYAYSVLAPYVAYLHVKDVRAVDPAHADPGDDHWHRFTDYERSYLTAPLGFGGINWAGLLAQLLADRYAGPLTLEPHAKPGHRDRAFAQAAKWLRGAIGNHGHGEGLPASGQQSQRTGPAGRAAGSA